MYSVHFSVTKWGNALVTEQKGFYSRRHISQLHNILSKSRNINGHFLFSFRQQGANEINTNYI